MKVIREFDIKYFCEFSIQHLYNVTDDAKKSAENYINYGSVDDIILSLYCLHEVETWGDMVDNPIIFHYKDKIIHGFSNSKYDIEYSNVKIIKLNDK